MPEPSKPAIPPPTRPEPYECCNRGCCPCIMDYYEDALERWKALMTARGFDAEALLADFGGHRSD